MPAWHATGRTPTAQPVTADRRVWCRGPHEPTSPRCQTGLLGAPPASRRTTPTRASPSPAPPRAPRSAAARRATRRSPPSMCRPARRGRCDPVAPNETPSTAGRRPMQRPHRGPVTLTPERTCSTTIARNCDTYACGIGSSPNVGPPPVPQDGSDKWGTDHADQSQGVGPGSASIRGYGRSKRAFARGEHAPEPPGPGRPPRCGRPAG